MLILRKESRVDFEDLKIGDCFYLTNKYFIKISNEFLSDCIDLKTGKRSMVFNGATVIYCDKEMN